MRKTLVLNKNYVPVKLLPISMNQRLNTQNGNRILVIPSVPLYGRPARSRRGKSTPMLLLPLTLLARLPQGMMLVLNLTAQAALGWLWARSDNTIPIPGFKTVKQVEENVGAAEFGPLTAEQMKEIDKVLER